jgi:hypothetical protein
MSEVWARCRQATAPGRLAGRLVRLVESQESVATLGLVDTLAEQARLEALLDAAKPPRRSGTEHLHYLLATPFRYPPLRHGSRFGSRQAAGLLYGSHRTGTMLAEAAYYRFLFWHGMTQAPPSGRLRTQHTSFEAEYATARGLRLQEPPCDAYRAVLAHPSDYAATQALGAALRAEGVEAIEFVSAREPDGGVNVALFEPGALGSPAPLGGQAWLCETRADLVRFSTTERWEHSLRAFPIGQFLVDGRLPLPAP